MAWRHSFSEQSAESRVQAHALPRTSCVPPDWLVAAWDETGEQLSEDRAAEDVQTAKRAEATARVRFAVEVDTPRPRIRSPPPRRPTRAQALALFHELGELTLPPSPSPPQPSPSPPGSLSAGTSPRVRLTPGRKVSRYPTDGPPLSGRRRRPCDGSGGARAPSVYLKHSAGVDWSRYQRGQKVPRHGGDAAPGCASGVAGASSAAAAIAVADLGLRGDAP